MNTVIATVAVQLWISYRVANLHFVQSNFGFYTHLYDCFRCRIGRHIYSLTLTVEQFESTVVSDKQTTTAFVQRKIHSQSFRSESFGHCTYHLYLTISTQLYLISFRLASHTIKFQHY